MTTPSSQFYSQQQLLLLLPPVILVVILAAAAEAQGGCLHKCGDIDTPFPFGIGVGPGCFRHGFEVLCNHSSDPPRAFLADDRTFKGEDHSNVSKNYTDSSRSPLELVSISVATGEAQVYAAVSYRCSTYNNDTYNNDFSNEFFSRSQQLDFRDTPFAMSATRNVLISVGLRDEAEAELAWSVGKYMTTSFTCRAQDGLSFRPHARNNASCTGWGCCERALPADEGSGKYFTLSVNIVDNNWVLDETKLCSYGMLVEKSWYNFSTPDMHGNMTLLQRFPRGVSLALDFAAGNTWCPAEGQPSPPDYACVSGNSYCANATTYTTDPGCICKCWDHYDGNPYIANGCQGTLHIPTYMQETVITHSLTPKACIFL